MKKSTEPRKDPGADREKTIVKTSVTGIVTNILLAAFKAGVGLLSNSIAVTLDAVNNLSDALSSVITLIGAKLGAKQPDKKHPLGYGRIEYLSALIVAGIVLYAGITSAVESIKKILRPEAASYSAVSLLIISVAIVVKLLLSTYVKRQGKKVHSTALIASGTEATFDVILSISVLASALVYLVFHISLEAYIGIAIAVFIIKSGIDMMRETVNDLIGHQYSGETRKQIQQILNAEPEVHGAYDLILYNYGPDKFYGSVHLELPDCMTIEEADQLTRRVQRKVYQETGVILTGVGVYSYNTSDDEAARIRNKIQETVLAHEWALQMHGFYADVEKKILRFDAVISFEVESQEAVKILTEEIQKLYPEYGLEIVADIDVID
ncbi:MAG: cation diffusion facilitator family transporter [Eubacterium sp.]|jgi:cation diffusion facilitator family transporter